MRGIALKLGLVGAACLVTLGMGGASTAKPTLKFAGSADPTFLDPGLVSDGESFRITEQIFEGLVALKLGKTTIQPALARRWKVARDGKTYTFFLRRGVKFHDGTPFNAAAVCANFNRWFNWRGAFQDASATYYYQAIFGGFRVNEPGNNLAPPLYRSCKTRGQFVAIIKLAKRNGPFLPSLSLSSFAMQSPTALRRYDADSGEIRNGSFRPTGTYAFQHPTGTGPLRFKEWTVGEKVVLQENKTYWGPQPRLGQVIVQPISTATGRLQALQSREVNAIDLVAPEHIATIRQDSRLKVLSRPAFNVGYVTINQAKPPMDKLKVRQAVAYGLDRAGVVRSFYGGRGVVAHEFQPPNLFGYEPRVVKYSYNPTKAKSLLRAAGLTLPVEIDFWYPTNVSRPYMPNPKLNFEAFAASLENSGFKVNAHSAPWRPDYVGRVNSGDAGHLNLIGWSGDYGDPDNFLGTFFQEYNPQFGFRNTKITNILNKAEQEVNFAKRVLLYKQANRMIMQYLPGVPYVHTQPALGMEKRVQHYIASPTGSDKFYPVFFGGGQ